jgi:D-alanyl-D-alanine carboxypeptidase
MNERNAGKRIGAALLALAALTLCACDARGAQATPGAAAPTPAATASPTATPVLPPVPTTPPEALPTPTATPQPTASYIAQVVCTANEYVNIRAEASAGSEVLGKLPAGETAGVMSFEGNWACVAYGGITGYVSRDYVIRLSEPDIAVPSGGWALILVNKASLLPEGFSISTAGFGGGQVDARILDICKQMFADAKEDGVEFKLVDAYRSFETQSALYEQKVQSYIAKGKSREDAEIEAATITARPNTSEHQTGLALDIVTPSYTKRDHGFADTRAFKWLDANAANYGFIMRYAKGKADITGVIYEPWHWRFVGVEAAKAMKRSGQSLEEYLGAG